MKFEDAKLPRHPVIEQALTAANDFYGNDRNAVFKESLWEARFLADNLRDKNPARIGAALLAPAVAAYGADFSVFTGTPLMEAVDNLVTGKPSMKENAANTLAGLAYGAMDLQAQFAESLALADGIGAGPMRDAYNRAAESHRADLSAMLKKLIAFAPRITAQLKDSEPQLVKAYGDIVAAAQTALAPKSPETPVKTTAPAAAP